MTLTRNTVIPNDVGLLRVRPDRERGWKGEGGEGEREGEREGESERERGRARERARARESKRERSLPASNAKQPWHLISRPTCNLQLAATSLAFAVFEDVRAQVT